MADEGGWEVSYYEDEQGGAPVQAFLESLPAKHRAKVRNAIERLRIFGPHLRFPDTSRVVGSPFRELRTRFAGQQYRVLYVQDGREFVLFVGFHKTSDRDLPRAVSEAERYFEAYRKE